VRSERREREEEEVKGKYGGMGDAILGFCSKSREVFPLVPGSCNCAFKNKKMKNTRKG